MFHSEHQNMIHEKNQRYLLQPMLILNFTSLRMVHKLFLSNDSYSIFAAGSGSSDC